MLIPLDLWGGVFQREELNRAEDFSQKYQLNLHYVDIDWNNIVEKYVDSVMIAKSAPVHLPSLRSYRRLQRPRLMETML